MYDRSSALHSLKAMEVYRSDVLNHDYNQCLLFILILLCTRYRFITFLSQRLFSQKASGNTLCDPMRHIQEQIGCLTSREIFWWTADLEGQGKAESSPTSNVHIPEAT